MNHLRGKSSTAARWLALALLLPPLLLGNPATSRAQGDLQSGRASSPLEPSRLRSAPPQQPATNAWQALPHGGLNGYVYALATVGGDLYAGGDFTETADGQVKDLNHIALLHNGAWQALPNKGLSNAVSALAVAGTDVYAGGLFSGTADGAVTNLGSIARLSSDGWHALADGGLDYSVTSLAVHGSDLYVGGFFDASAHGAVTGLGAIARYTNGNWVALPNQGLQDHIEHILLCCSVESFAFSGSDMVAGGDFDRTGDHSIPNLNDVALLSGGVTWSALPNSGLGTSGIGGHVYGLVYQGSDLYAAGTFTETHDGQVTSLNSLAVLHNGAWTPVPDDGLRLQGYRFGSAYALTPRGNDLYVGGNFTETADGAVRNLGDLAQLSGGAWHALPNGGLRSGPTGNGVRALTFGGDTLYAGGDFTETADGAVQNLGNIAMLGVPPVASYPLYLPLVTR